MKLINNIKNWFRYNLEFIKIFNSPFKKPKLNIYFGPISIGTPYFLPRKLVKLTEEEVIEEANKILSKDPIPFYYKDKTLDEVIKSKLGTRKFVPRKFGFNWCTFGWKPKWDSYRFEWEPRLSFVAFNKQFVIGLISPIDFEDVYWEAWLYYNNCTKGSKKERFIKCINEHSCTWTRYSKEEEISTDYYTKILNKKYLKLYSYYGQEN